VFAIRNQCPAIHILNPTPKRFFVDLGFYRDAFIFRPYSRSTRRMSEGYPEFRTLDEVRVLMSERSNPHINRLSDLLARMNRGGAGETLPLTGWHFRVGDDDRGLNEPLEGGGWTLVNPGFRYSGPDFHAWLRRDVRIPERIGSFQTSGRAILLHVVVDYDGEVYLDGRSLGLLRRMPKKWDVPLSEAAQPGQIIQVAIKIYKRSHEMTLDLRQAYLMIAEYGEILAAFTAVKDEIEAYARGVESLPEADIDPTSVELLEEAGETALSFPASGDLDVSGEKLKEAKKIIGRLSLLRRKRPSIVRGPFLQAVTQTGITAVWETDVEAPTELLYGETSRYDSRILRGEPVRYHKVRLTGLTPGKAYHLRCGCEGIWGKDVPFKTAPPAPRPFRMAVWGDCDGDCRYHELLLDLMLSHSPDLAVCTGDIGGAFAESLRCFFDPIRKLTGIPFYVAIGNHEYGDATADYRIPAFERLLDQPGNGYYFSFDYGNSHFIVLDAHRPRFTDISPESEEGRWLVADLASRSSKEASFRFVFVHEPPFSQNWEGTDYDGEEALRRHLVPLMERFRVSAVFSGHAHDYERGRLPRDTGPFYVVTGGANNNPDFTRKRTWPHVELTHSDQHFLLVDVGSTEAVARAIDRRGRIIDRFVMGGASMAGE